MQANAYAYYVVIIHNTSTLYPDLQDLLKHQYCVGILHVAHVERIHSCKTY